MRFFIRRNFYTSLTELAIIGDAPQSGQGSRIYVMPTQLRIVQNGEPAEPFIAIDSQETTLFQSMMDELWQLGIRPSDIGTPGHLAATQKHLGDMRAIVASFLKTELPK